MVFLVGVMALGGASLGIIFAEINQSEDVFLEHVQEPCHGVACSNLENVKEDVSEIKADLKALDTKLTAWYEEREP